ncbi:MAG: bifunctional riboflavin kinase/FAD synthetase [Lachnospiraceae bacterium]
MEYIKNTIEFNINEPTVLTLGKFDGLHMGHKYLLEHLFAEKKNGLKVVIFTFDMPPRRAFDCEETKVLTTNLEKEYIFESCGIDYLVECPFTQEIMTMEAEDFVEMIVTRLHVKSIVVGNDFRFGHNRGGDYHLLQQLSNKFGYKLEVVKKMQYHGEDISSTYVRRELESGHLATANKLLGYEFFIEEQVIDGKKLGRTMNTPTINLMPAKDKLLPPFGVYISKIYMDEKEYGGITNIGKKPTVGDENPVGIETNIFDFNENVYGKTVRVSLLYFIREEIKFETMDELEKQIEKDILFGKDYLKEYKMNKLWHQ